MTTLKQVAEAAGVSMKTVSRVTNGSPEVAPETRQRVETVIKQMSYQPNRLARSLVSGKTNTIGVLVHHSVHHIFEYPFFNKLLGGISKALNEHKLDLLLHFIDEGSSYTELYEQQRVDGLIVTNAPINNPDAKKLLNIPCVFTSRIALENNLSHWVDSNFQQGTTLAVNHLANLGHRQIALLPGPNHLAISHLRLLGYRNALTTLGIAVDEALIQTHNLFVEASLARKILTEQWLTLKNPPTAIIASDDITAINLTKELTEMGYKIPADISVVGFDNTLLSEAATPQLTSVGQQAFHKGYVATTTLLEILAKTPKSPIQINLEMELVVRDSTDSAPLLENMMEFVEGMA